MEVTDCKINEDMVGGYKDIRFLMLSASPQMKILGEENGPTVSKFSRRMRAEWRRGGCPKVDREDVMLDSVSPDTPFSKKFALNIM